MTTTPLHIASWRNVQRLDKTRVSLAVESLKNLLCQYPVGDIVDLRNRIEENRESWIHGRDGVPCDFCYGTGTSAKLAEEVWKALEAKNLSTPEWHVEFKRLWLEPANRIEEEVCPVCNGTLKTHEMGMHFGWGMGIRNYLRQQGYGEKWFGIDNLDDFYVTLVEMALGFSAPEGA